ncbi:MAG: hypothetical protein JWN43_3800, partial [Gammaproteobacteria bacterium]|nr:hypothetical protein [Gammaproteobacteria bacterium]
MNIIEGYPRHGTWLISPVLVASAVGCGGNGKHAILGSSDGAALAPTITTVTPANGTINAKVVNPIITATFDQPMAAISGGSSFTVTCLTPCVNPSGTVALDAANRIATFAPAIALAPLTLYTATITGAASLGTGLALASPYVWQFTTGAAPPPPTVAAVAPVNNAVGVPINQSIAATFSEPMTPITGA